MIIDFHTHIFPDNIAQAVTDNAEQSLGLFAKAPATEKGLREHIERGQTDVAVVLAVAVHPRLVRKTNDWLLAIRDDQVHFFGTLLPEMDDWEQELTRLSGAGVKGIKFNALLQNIRPDAESLFPIYQQMADNNMIAVFHAGGSVVVGDHPQEVLATPKRIARVLDTFPELRVIAAHFGGIHMHREVQKHLLGRDVFFDTSYPPDIYSLSPTQATSMIREHGVSKILFGTDYPWETQSRSIKYINGLELSATEKRLILGQNAQTLLFADSQSS